MKKLKKKKKKKKKKWCMPCHIPNVSSSLFAILYIICL